MVTVEVHEAQWLTNLPELPRRLASDAGRWPTEAWQCVRHRIEANGLRGWLVSDIAPSLFPAVAAGTEPPAATPSARPERHL